MGCMESRAPLGQLIRELRLAVGWSQARLADHLSERARHATITRDEVKRWESGKRTPGPYWLAHLATVLQVPLDILEDDVKRRTFLTSASASAIAPIIASDLLTHGFDARLTPAASPDWDAKVEQYGHDYMRLGAADMQRRLTGDLIILQQQLETPHSWGVAAKLMTLYAKTFPGSDGAKAVHWYRKAAQAADRAHDPGTAVWVRGRAAIALGYEGAALPVADLLAEQAIQMSGGKPSLGMVNAVMGKAHAAGIRGNRSAALELLDHGRRIFDTAGSDDQDTDYAVPWWRFNVFASLLAARLGDEPIALRAQEQALRELPPALPRFRTHLLMHQGLMMTRAGDPAGVTHARTALDDLPPQSRSLTLRMLMDEIDPPNGPSPAPGSRPSVRA